MPRIKVYNADRYVVAANVNANRCKLFQIAFGKRDGSLFVTFPYLKDCIGRVGEITLPSGSNFHKQFKIQDEFPVTSHLVKYSHHPSGDAHFSLTGKVKTSVRTKSVPLSKVSGHIFTVRFQGFHYFSQLESLKKATAKRGIVEFPFETKFTSSIKIVCHWYSEAELTRFVPPKMENPWFVLPLPEGRKAVAIILAAPNAYEGERRYLLLGAERDVEPLNGEEKGISFMGGFDSEKKVFDYTDETRFLLMFISESKNITELVAKYGTIDL